ncbi:hypothetical protein EXS56_02900 [Candidatus Kaiserbacteria bacterium]|nr:hypothetical protein [Candidatus Kaiserbacteria bacterium]
MITLIHNTLKTLPHLSGDLDGLSFIKYSTPTSGKTLDDKVIFLAFKLGMMAPFLCIKTVRNYGARETIVRSFNNLKQLNRLTAGSRYEQLFPRALHVYDDGEHIFSIETACSGGRAILDRTILQTVVGEYTGFQAHVAKRPLREVDELAEHTIRTCGLSELDQNELRRFYDSLPVTPVRLPSAVQLGDLTEDNMLFSHERIFIVDFDMVGIVDVPGFDLFGLLFRFNQKETAALVREYFPDYFAKIGAEIGDNEYARLLFLYYVAERTLRKPYLIKTLSAKKIIVDFSRLFL